MLTVNGAGGGGIVNGTFESGNLNGWTLAGVRSVTSTNPHGGSFAAMLGSTSPSGQSTLLQTFTVPAGATQLSLFYLVACPDVVSNDFATVRLKDNVTGTTTAILANTCTNNGTWTPVTASVIAGRSYTITLGNKDNGTAGTATFTKYDDVTVS
jgi:serine protease